MKSPPVIKRFVDILDNPPQPNEKLRALMARKAPWETSAPLIMAIDASGKAIGVAEGRAGETPRLYSMHFKSKNDEPEDIGGKVMAWFSVRLEELNPDVVYIEAPIEPGAPGVTTTPETMKILIGLWFAMASECKSRGWAVRKANVQTVRTGFIGCGRVFMPKGSPKGAGSKEAKRRVFEMCRLLGWAPTDRDASDAGALFWYACTRYAPNLAAPITSIMHAKVATTIRGVDIGGAEALFKRARA